MGKVTRQQDVTHKRPSLWKKWLLVLTGLIVTGLGLGLLTIFLVIRHFSADLPDVSTLEDGYAPPQVTRILARDRSLLENIYTERRTVVPLEQVPDHVKHAFLAAEDARFYEHQGLNPLGLLRAILVNLRSGRVRQGGSTITQQVVKNVLLDAERSYQRKIRETILAYQMEQRLTKEQILGMYLNHIYLGHGRYGVEEASRYIFGKHVQELSVAQGALLAGIVASPERYSPRKNMEKALSRRKYVLGQMLSKGFMSQVVYDAALVEPVLLPPNAEAESGIAPEVVRLVRKQLKKEVGAEAAQGGYTLVTTLNPSLQILARKALRNGLDDYPRRHKLKPPYTLKKRRIWGKAFSGTPRQHRIYTGRVVELNDAEQALEIQVGDAVGRVQLAREDRYNPQRLLPSQFTQLGALMRVRLMDAPKKNAPQQPIRMALELGPQGAIVVLDVESGDVLALAGNYEALPGAFDRATQSRRQPGSTFKPLVYSYGLSTGKINAATPFTFPLSEKQKARQRAAREQEQQDFPDKLFAPLDEVESISLRQGVASSDNRVAEATMRRVGAQNVVDWSHRLGINSKLGADLSLALGAYEVTPLEMVAAYSVFARGGKRLEPRMLLEIRSGAGVLPMAPRPASQDVMTPGTAYLMTSILQSVIDSGTAGRARSLGRPLAGKTGTTNKARDAWFVGYSPQYAVAVWVGYDDTLPLGWGEAGSVTALPIWMEFMKGAHQGQPITAFPVPAEIERLRVDPKSGLLARFSQSDAVDEIFIRGKSPTLVAQEPPAVVGVQAELENGVEGDGAQPNAVDETNSEDSLVDAPLPPPPLAPADSPAPALSPLAPAASPAASPAPALSPPSPASAPLGIP